jgi:hypothetical protein
MGGVADRHNPDDDVGMIGKIQFFEVPSHELTPDIYFDSLPIKDEILGMK